MAEFLVIDDLNLEFDSKETVSKVDPFSPCSQEPAVSKRTNKSKEKITSVTQDSSKFLGREIEKPSSSIPKNSENTTTESNVSNRKGSFTGLGILDRVSTSMEREKKVWMGQNNVDTRRRSYTAITSESLAKFDDEAQLFLTRKTSVPAEKPSKVSDIFEDSHLESQAFDALFLDSNNLALK